jgi:hypothetical protein
MTDTIHNPRSTVPVKYVCFRLKEIIKKWVHAIYITLSYKEKQKLMEQELKQRVYIGTGGLTV